MSAAGDGEEFERIHAHFRPLAVAPEALALRDDAAFLPGGAPLVITTDTLVAEVHFFPEDDPSLIARKALRVNLSDLAAMGAEPYLYFLNLSAPASLPESWWARFAQGLGEDQRAFGIALAGGDTTSTPGPVTVTVTALGKTQTPWRRGGAKAGDALFVTGTLGDAALGLAARQGKLPALRAEHAAALEARYLLPQPRLEARALGGLAHAAIDLSDGLLADLGHLAEASGLGAEVRLADLPLSDAARAALAQSPSLEDAIYAGGDDYELLLAMAPQHEAQARRLLESEGIRLTRIGCMAETKGVRLYAADGAQVVPQRRGYRHFGGPA